MTKTDALLDPIVQSPRLGLYVRRLQGVLEDERARRERFYEEMVEGTKVEFINGEVVVPSPVKLKHSVASDGLYVLLKTHASRLGLGLATHEKIMVSLTRNDYEPDVSFWETAKSSQFTPNQMHFPAPDFIAEVLSESTEVRDRGVKFDDYAAHGVREYWLVDPEGQAVEQYLLAGDEFALKAKVSTGTIRSEVIAGFEIPVRAIFDERENLDALQRIMNS